MYYLVVGLLSALLVWGVLLFRGVFFGLVRRTTGLLNHMLDKDSDEDIKQKNLTQGLGLVLASIGLLVLSLAVIVGVPLGLFMGYLQIVDLNEYALDFSSVYFYGSMLIGSFIPIIPLLFKKKKNDYTELSILIHQIILDNQNLALSLFSLEKWMFSGRKNERNNTFIVISGLARAGTTALTSTLFRSGRFHSLSYADMPFLTSPNIWRKLSGGAKKHKLKERSHKDGVMIGVQSVEALEEYFWKTQLRNSYIQNDRLVHHKVSEEIYENYLHYQSLVKPKGSDPSTLYLAKNNNFMLRYPSMRKFNKEFHVLLLFRDPLDHAYSLLKQHRRYNEMQANDDFVKDY